MTTSKFFEVKGARQLNDLAVYGKVASVIDPTTFTTTITGLGDNKFLDYAVYVYRDVGGIGSNPQGEVQLITSYLSSTGQFQTFAAFTSPLLVGDEILIIHPSQVSAMFPWRKQFVWSDFLPQIVLTDVAADVDLGTLNISIPSQGILGEIDSIRVFIKFSDRDNTNVGVNSLSGAQDISLFDSTISSGDVICSFIGGEYSTQPSSYGFPGDVIIGHGDASGLYHTIGPDNYHVIWQQALASGANLNFNNIQVGAEITFR